MSILRVRGETWVSRLNAELHAAQKARKQPVADGYTYYVHTDGQPRPAVHRGDHRARAGPRAQAQLSILKLMETTRYEVKLHAAPDAGAAGRPALSRRR